MKNKQLIMLVLSFLLLVLASCKNNSDSVTVFSGGETEYSIVTAEGASEEAWELANRLSDLSGAFPEVLTDTSAEKSFEILVGDTNRPATSELVKTLKSKATVSAFHYIIAENNGKIVILSDSDVGYIYALDYIEKTYINDGVFTISKDTCDIKQVMWADYYASELYYERLVAEADKSRDEEEKNQFDDDLNKYNGNNGSGILTLEQVINKYKLQLSSFNSADFGEYTGENFTNGNVYGEINLYPEESHPRILFTEKTVGTVRARLEKEENAAAYKRYITLSDVPTDGKFNPVTGNAEHNWDESLVGKIEAKAFRYAMERNAEKYPNKDDDPASIYGYEAIIAAKNAMLTINVPHTVGDWCRTYGYLMYVVACTYDWCYDLMTEADKEQIIAGGVNLLGVHLELTDAITKVPSGQGTIYGHGAEDQLLVDYLSFAIACYGDASEIYEFVGGRILNYYVEAQNYLFKSGAPWDGSMYGAGGRSSATIMANIMFSRMNDQNIKPFTDKIEDAIVTTTYYMRPDNQPFRIGDINENRATYNGVGYGVTTFLAASLYENSYLKAFSYDWLSGFTYFSNGVAAVSSIQFLALNDPEISHVYTGTAPLIRTATYPGTSLFAKSAHDDKNAFALYMTMPENYVSSHAHMECGSFQIYYKDSLATDSGAYTDWGMEHHMGYNMQTISSNSLLIYNPDFKDYINPAREYMVYSGGQSIDNGANLPMTYEELMNHPGLGQCTSLGVASSEEGGVYLYSYMGGDMTKAYDEDTVNEVIRYMIAVATDNAECPYVFVTFDKITSDKASYHKSALIHVQNAPDVFGDYYLLSKSTEGKLTLQDSDYSDTYAIIKNGDGKLVVQTVGEATEFTVIGGEDYEFWLPGVDEDKNYSLEAGKNLATGITLAENSIAEYGWGRIEISPAEAAEKNQIMTVMYVTDATNNNTPAKAAEIKSDNLAGTVLFGRAIMFPENEGLLTEESSFTLSSRAECYIAGVAAGTWTVTNGSDTYTVEVKDGENLLTFTAASAGTYRVTRTN